MPETTQPPVHAKFIKPQNLPVANPREVKAVYSNFFGASATMTDFTIFFMQVGQMPGPTGPSNAQEVQAIVTLPLMAISGLRSLLAQIEAQAEAAMAEVEKATASGKE